MKSRIVVPLLCCTAWALVIAGNRAVHADEAGFDEIFNGRDMVGWMVEGTSTRKEGEQTVPVWTVADGELRCGGGGFGFLRFDREVCDFVFQAEFKLAKGSNSGVGIRTVPYRSVRQTRPSFAAYEVQLQDDGAKPPDEHSSGSLYRYVAPTASAVKPAGEWNTVEIRCMGPRIMVVINGQQVLDVDQTTVEQIKNKPLCGYVSLQNHGSAVAFRKLRLKTIKAGA